MKDIDTQANEELREQISNVIIAYHMGKLPITNATDEAMSLISLHTEKQIREAEQKLMIRLATGRKLSEARAFAAKRLYNDGYTYREIMKVLNLKSTRSIHLYLKDATPPNKPNKDSQKQPSSTFKGKDGNTYEYTSRT